jgi:predicted XRE-type DNA-binding protein
MRRAGKTKEDRDSTVQESSGNVFADLELSAPEELLAKAELVHRICAIIGEKKLTQSKAAVLLGMDQPKVSALMHGKFDGFSTDRLFRFLNALGRDVEIVIGPERQTGEAKTRVVSV